LTSPARITRLVPSGLLLLVPVVLAALTALAALAPRTARAASGPCLADGTGPRCHYWYGRAKFVADGDTLDVRINGIGLRRIRLTGINAMEMTRYSKYANRRRGACHALAATARLEQLIRAGRRRVRLAAQHASSRAGHRLRRQVSVRIGNAWVDTGQVLLAEGHALWLPNGRERAWNRRYREASQQAARHHLHMFNPLACGGPARNAVLRLTVRWDAKGNDRRNPNGEWIRIRNRSSFAVSLARWWVRDSALRRFTFPRGTVLRPGQSLRVMVGRGRRHGRVFHWGLNRPAFENSGDGAYLFDPRGDIRAFEIYPG
jgi:micrococcal nuclease